MLANQVGPSASLFDILSSSASCVSLACHCGQQWREIPPLEASESPGLTRQGAARRQNTLSRTYGGSKFSCVDWMGHVPQAGCSESQVREYFTKLRSNVRAFMQKLQRKVSAAEAPSAATDLRTSSPTAPQLPLSGSSAPAALGGTPAAPPMHPQFTPQSAAQSAPALSATASGGSSASLQPSVAAAGFPQSQAATPALPAGAGQPHASPMTATDLRTMLTNAASASSASASLAVRAASFSGDSSVAECKFEPGCSSICPVTDQQGIHARSAYFDHD